MRIFAPRPAVLILKAERVYAELLGQLVRSILPDADVRLVHSLGAACTSLATCQFDLLLTGALFAEGDVEAWLDRLAKSTHPSRKVLVISVRRELRLLHGLMRRPSAAFSIRARRGANPSLTRCARS